MYGIFGNITTPFGTKPGFAKEYQDVTSGLPFFISNVVRVLTIVAGLWMFFNLVLAGFNFMTANGKQEQNTKAWSMIWQSLVGLVIIGAAFALTAVISQLLFGKTTTLLIPTIYGPGTP